MNLSFAMTGRVCDCVQLTYRTPAKTVRAMLPDGLELVVRGPWAFWNVMGYRVEQARPVGAPAFCGLTYRHVAYRLLVQAMNDRAEVVRGCFTTRSDADARVVSVLGNRLSGTRTHPASIRLDADDCGVRIEVCQPRVGTVETRVVAAHAPARLAPNSCFPTTEDTRRFCRHTPTGLVVAEQDGRRLLKVTRVERDERAWCETPVVLRVAELPYFESIGQAEHVQLEWACRLGPMDYRWAAAETVPLLQQRIPAIPTVRAAI